MGSIRELILSLKSLIAAAMVEIEADLGAWFVTLPKAKHSNVVGKSQIPRFDQIYQGILYSDVEIDF